MEKQEQSLYHISKIILKKRESMHRIVNRQLNALKELKNEEGSENTQNSSIMYNATAVKPDDQLILSLNELEEEHARVLTINNPSAPHNIIQYNYKERRFKPITYIDQTYIHLNITGNLVYRDSEEGRAYEIKKKAYEANRKNYYIKSIVDEFVDEDGQTKFRILKNNINFCDRASQTLNNACRDIALMTEPPEKKTFSGHANQYIIYVSYLEHQEYLELTMKSKKKSTFEAERIKTAARQKKRIQAPPVDNKVEEAYRMLLSAKLIERMICQNQYEDVIHDFRYYDDISDSYRSEGSLLPLWKFSDHSTKNLSVTCMCWNPKYHDFFAVSCGSYDFLNDTNGVIILYSLKTPSFFEWKILTNSGCVSLDFHPTKPYLIAAGFYDGTVNVFDCRTRSKKEPKFAREQINDRHRDPVWQVQWQPDDLNDNHNFISVSSDGRVLSWTLRNSILVADNVATLDESSNKANKQTISINDAYDVIDSSESASCFDVNVQQDNLIIVGTENGTILEYSKSHLNCLLTKYEEHSMTVYRLQWNNFFKRVFISCSADWTVRIWDTKYKNSILKFDLNGPVADVSWSPYSSTVFAAITVDGNVFIFDLAISKLYPICVQNILNKKKRKLTHVCFNPSQFIILVSDDKGNVYSFKLSPNLRSVPRDSKNNPITILNKFNYEVIKISKLLSGEVDTYHPLAVTSRRPFKEPTKPAGKLNEKEEKEIDFDEEEKKQKKKLSKLQNQAVKKEN